MMIETRAMEFPVTDAIRAHVDARVGAAVGPVARWVLNVTARLEDVNADRGGVDKRARVVATLRHRGAVVAEGTDADLYVAVDLAASRLRRSCLRAVKRHVARERKDPQRPGALVGR
jgi:ribosomal subunit interface protein